MIESLSLSGYLTNKAFISVSSSSADFTSAFGLSVSSTSVLPARAMCSDGSSPTGMSGKRPCNQWKHMDTSSHNRSTKHSYYLDIWLTKKVLYGGTRAKVFQYGVNGVVRIRCNGLSVLKKELWDGRETTYHIYQSCDGHMLNVMSN